MKIQWSSTAVGDLESIREYIANDSPRAARKVSEKIKGAVIPGTSYVTAYIIQGDEVQIAAVLHGRQDWPESFEPRTENDA